MIRNSETKLSMLKLRDKPKLCYQEKMVVVMEDMVISLRHNKYLLL